MFDIVQKYSTASKIVLGIIGLTFVVAGGVVGSGAVSGENYLVKVGDQPVTLEKLREIAKQRDGEITDQVQKDILLALTQQAYLLEGAKRMGVVVSDEQLKKSSCSKPFSKKTACLKKVCTKITWLKTT